MEATSTIVGDDGIARCAWVGTDPLYLDYHDREWGRPVHGEVALFERICLEGFQAGLAWITILRKRPAFRSAFAGFDPSVVSAYGSADVERLLGDPGIVRHRGKVEATVGNARALMAMHERGESLENLVWSHRPAAHARPGALESIATQTAESRQLSRALKERGFRFVGPTTMYAAMQACGLVDDHVVDCAAARVQDS
jgi:DNA-3-methyladenine glycosylase I